MAKPARADVKPRVEGNLETVSGVPVTAETQELATDLGLSKRLRGALAPGFQKIARESNPSATISMTECEKLKTVGAAIDLVHGRA